MSCLGWGLLGVDRGPNFLHGFDEAFAKLLRPRHIRLYLQYDRNKAVIIDRKSGNFNIDCSVL